MCSDLRTEYFDSQFCRAQLLRGQSFLALELFATCRMLVLKGTASAEFSDVSTVEHISELSDCSTL